MGVRHWVSSTVSVSATDTECRWTQCQCRSLWSGVGGQSVSATDCVRVSQDTVPIYMGVRHWVSSTVSVSATDTECRWTQCQCRSLWSGVGGQSVSATDFVRVSVDKVSVSLTVAECQWTKCQCLAQTRIYDCDGMT
ncbi:hypothetical protein Fcan01_15160 [Folsomia candida]|uniref:Uncharacterized protein n=1 Tax=Folsomia candida TaxID=158441 RepID=A0A226DYY1_FOLCA|nr:hypothetical protein Fcan01_15160 [Folsomia candida]